MANATNTTQAISFAGQYTGLGIMQGGGPNDSGVVAKSASPATVSITFATDGGTQLTIQRGKWMVGVTAVNGSGVLGAIDIYATDGTNTEYLALVPASSSATAGQGATFMGEFFSALINITNIVTVTARMVTTTSNVASLQLVVCGGM